MRIIIFLMHNWRRDGLCHVIDHVTMLTGVTTGCLCDVCCLILAAVTAMRCQFPSGRSPRDLQAKGRRCIIGGH